MLPQLLGLFLMIGLVTAVLGIGGYFVCRAAIKRAMSQGVGDDRATRQLIQDFENDLAEMREELTDLRDRVDFAERTLAGGGPNAVIGQGQ